MTAALEEAVSSMQQTIRSMHESIELLQTRVSKLETLPAEGKHGRTRDPRRTKRSEKEQRRLEEKSEQESMIKDLVRAEVARAVADAQICAKQEQVQQQLRRPEAEDRREVGLVGPETLEQLVGLMVSHWGRSGHPNLARLQRMWELHDHKVSEAARSAAEKIATEGLDERLLRYVTKTELAQEQKELQGSLGSEHTKLALMISKMHERLGKLEEPVQQLTIQRAEVTAPALNEAEQLEHLQAQVERVLYKLGLANVKNVSPWLLEQKADRSYCEHLFDSLSNQVAVVLDKMEHHTIAGCVTGVNEVRSRLRMPRLPVEDGLVTQRGSCLMTRSSADKSSTPQTARQWMPEPPNAKPNPLSKSRAGTANPLLTKRSSNPRAFTSSKYGSEFNLAATLDNPLLASEGRRR